MVADEGKASIWKSETDMLEMDKTWSRQWAGHGASVSVLCLLYSLDPKISCWSTSDNTSSCAFNIIILLAGSSQCIMLSAAAVILSSSHLSLSVFTVLSEKRKSWCICQFGLLGPSIFFCCCLMCFFMCSGNLTIWKFKSESNPAEVAYFKTP